MRYFKCDTVKEEDRELFIEEPKLTEEEQKSDRVGRLLNILGTALWCIVFVSLFLGSVFAILKISAPQNPFLFALYVLLSIVLLFLALLLSGALASVVASPLFGAAQKKLVVKPRIAYDKSILTLREYYGWNAPCLVTKCYEASDKKFKNRDICLFFADGELRLTADLKHGFSLREKDLGCYAFHMDEITLSHVQNEQHIMTELRTADVLFLLGRRAKGFIEANTVSTREDG